VTRALRRALGCHGFNVGMNVGAVAGAGVASHLHQHVVPRWEGDANFMPILGSTMVMPELIPVTYAKLRAELARDGDSPSDARATCVVLAGDDTEVLVARTGGGWRLPVATAGPDEALWRAAVRTITALASGGSGRRAAVSEVGASGSGTGRPPGVAPTAAGGYWASLAAQPELVGWAGAARATSSGTIALTFRVEGSGGLPAPEGARWIGVAEIDAVLGDGKARLVRAALANLAPSVAAP